MQSPAVGDDQLQAPGHARITQLESSLAEKDLWVLMDTKLNVSQQCVLATYLWLQKAKYLLQMKRDDPFTLLSTGETASGVLSSPVQEYTGENSAKSHQDDEGPGASFL